MLSELAQFLIQDHCASHSWTLSSYQGNPKLPRDLFLSDKDAERTSEVYLPDEWYVSRGTKVPQHASKVILSSIVVCL